MALPKKKEEQVSIHEAKTHLSRLLTEVTAGNEVVIAKAGTPIAKLIPFQRQQTHRVAGMDAGNGWIADDFDAPLPKAILKGFY